MARKRKKEKKRAQSDKGTNTLVRKYGVILNIRVNSTELAEVLKFAEEKIRKKERFFVVTPNPEIIVMAQSDPVLSSCLNSADISLPDGMGLVWASKWLALKERLAAPATPFSKTLVESDGRSEFSNHSSLDVSPGKLQKFKHESRTVPGSTHFSKGSPSPLLTNHYSLITHRVSGIDVMEALIKNAAEKNWKVFLLGGKPGVAAQAATKLKIKNEKLKIDSYDGPWLDNSGRFINKMEEEKEKTATRKINQFRPHLLFVGFGAPKQEKWTAINYNKLETLGTMVVGGAFDYISGSVPRAPKWLRDLGLEWFFRLIVEPRRAGRQLALLKFIWLVLKESRSPKKK